MESSQISTSNQVSCLPSQINLDENQKATEIK